MVSGFLTSPYDQERIFSGEARPVLIASNSSSCVTCLNRSSSAFIRYSLMAFRWQLEGWQLEGCWLFADRSEALEIDVDRQRADFLHQHVERLGHARLDLVL